MIAIRQRLSPPAISEGEIKLAETERSMVPLQNRQRELSQLVQKKLAPPQSLEQVNQDLRLLTQERTALQKRLRQDRQSLQDDQAVLKQQLGNGVSSGQIPQEAALIGPHRRLCYLDQPGLAEWGRVAPHSRRLPGGSDGSHGGAGPGL